jgi:hypothetical protein
MHSSTATVTWGIPQGSVLGPVLYAIYTAPLHHIVLLHGLTGHYYADDTQIYASCDAVQLNDNIARVEACIADILNWLLLNNLCLNTTKTELLLCGTKQQLAKINDTTITLSVGTDTVMCTPSARNLGVLLDKHLTFDAHIGKICQASFFNIRKLARIRRYLSPQTAAVIGAAIVASKLDYCNSILTGITTVNIKRLQRVQNALARVIYRVPRREHITSTLMQLHWLPIPQRIDFKLGMITWKSINFHQPAYLAELLTLRTIRHDRCLRERGTELVVPRSSTKLGERAFSSAAPRLWNSLPLAVRSAPTLVTFKSKLKTFLYKQAYDI